MDEKDFGKLVWVADAEQGYALGTLTDISTNGMTISIRDKKHPKKVVARYDEVFLAEEDETKTVEDNCSLMYLNEGTLLHNCKLRYSKKQIYSYVANILLSINPYEQIPQLYSHETMRDYRGKSIGQRPPHVYAIADKAYRDMMRNRWSQSIVVSGESGAGKTESQKAILKYLCANWGEEADLIRRKIKETNPILEAFGNSKTTRNNNSSRFGKFVEIHFDSKGRVAGGFVSHYLLEKSRVCKQSEGERSYHIFYEMIAGLDSETYKKLHLAPVKHFNYLKHGITSFFAGKDTIDPARKSNKDSLSDPIVEDRRDFEYLVNALKNIGMDQTEILNIWKTVAGVLHLGNISFIDSETDSRGGSTLDPTTELSLKYASELLGVEHNEFRMGLTTRIMQATKGGGVLGTIIRVPLKPHEAASARDALAKAIYSKLFDYLVARINSCINNTDDGSVNGSHFYIGVLDIAGFEFFAINSFEQFCINYCNEKLQNFFNERILKQEQQLYESEGVQVPRIEFYDNQDCIDLFERKSTGLLDLMDEEARLPRSSPQHYTQQALAANKNHFHIEMARKSRLRNHREMRDDDGFLIRHYAGSVCYHTQQFLEKNNDQLHHSLQFLIEESSFKFICKLFETNSIELPQRTTKKLQGVSVCSKFRAQLNILLDKLRSTGTHFIRCLKPNSLMKPNNFDSTAILDQLRCAGMASVLKLMQKGYPNRTSFNELYEMYKSLLPKDLALLHPRLFCKCLFRALGMSETDSCFGLTKVFFRSGKFAEFDQLMKQDPEHMKYLIGQVRTWLIRSRWHKVQYGSWMVIKLKKKIEYRSEYVTKLQAALRGYLVRKQYKPRLEIYRSSLILQQRAIDTTKIIKELEASSAAKWSKSVVELNTNINKLISYIKSNQFEILKATKQREECSQNVNQIILLLKKQLQDDEQLKLLKLEEKRLQEQERLRRQEQEQQQRLADRQIRKEHEEEREKSERQWLSEREKTESKRQVLVHQERLDYQLASRLAKDDHQAIVEIPSIPISTQNINTNKGKNDLSSWSFPELRDTINTSTDLELLTACKDEFTRRVRIYNEWKSTQKPNMRQ